MGNVMQIAIEALAVLSFDFMFAFLTLPALSKVAARDALFPPFPFGPGADTVHSGRTCVEAEETVGEPSYPHQLWLFLRNPAFAFSTLVPSFTPRADPGHVQFLLGTGSQF